MRWFHLAEESTTYLVILGALAAGMAASYGRELEAKRRPDGHWWVRRLLVIPLLAIAATAATELFGLSKSGAALMAAMLSMGGYDAVRLIEARWKHRIEAATEAASATRRGSDEL